LHMSIVTPKSHAQGNLRVKRSLAKFRHSCPTVRKPLFSAAPTKPALVRGRSVRRSTQLCSCAHKGLRAKRIRQRATCKGHHKIGREGSHLEQEPKEEHLRAGRAFCWIDELRKKLKLDNEQGRGAARSHPCKSRMSRRCRRDFLRPGALRRCRTPILTAACPTVGRPQHRTASSRRLVLRHAAEDHLRLRLTMKLGQPEHVRFPGHLAPRLPR
jgi:hypothetical protein